MTVAYRKGTWVVRDFLSTFCRAVALCGLVLSASGQAGHPAKSSANSRISFRNAAPGIKYVGSAQCKLCHSEIYQNFSRTAMGRATFLPDKVVDLGWLPKPVEFFNENHNRHYQVFARNGKVFESEYQLAQGKEVFRHTEELAYVVGTGANGATPIVRKGNYLFQAPISYYTAKKAWGLSPNYENQDLAFTLPITPDCIYCHSGRTQPGPGREGLYLEPPIAELGISCENCHGPGELHVRERLHGAPLSPGMDRSIVNPAKLSPWLADNICMNCHEGDIRTLQPGKKESDFRPGTPLNETVAILKPPIDPQSAQSPLLEHYYSMTLSKCYQGSKGRLGCQSCHDPHIEPSAAEAPKYFRERCLQCHTEKSCTLGVEKRISEQPDDACSNCHMPKQPALTVSHSTLTDHRIVRTTNEPYPESAYKSSLPGTGFIHVNAVAGAHDTVPPVSLLRAYRQELIRSHLEFKDYYFDLLEKLRQAGNKDPFVISALAQKASSDGDLKQAIAYAAQVVDQGSVSSYDYLLLDELYVKSGDIPESIKVLKKGLTIAPYNNVLYQNLAIRQFTAGNIDDGLETLKKGLELFPEDSGLREIRERAITAGLLH